MPKHQSLGTRSNGSEWFFMISLEAFVLAVQAELGNRPTNVSSISTNTSLNSFGVCGNIEDREC
jgi:hypothetical protein